MATNPEIFIIESLRFEEEADYREGEILSRMLKFIGKDNTIYFYIRTRAELEEVIDKFEESEHRYLHFSCHADRSGIATTLDNVSYEELGAMLSGCLLGRRVFVSGCKMANDRLAKALFKDAGCSSLLGPSKNINFDDSAAFWLMFYHMMFKRGMSRMKHVDIDELTQQLSSILDEPFDYYKSDPTAEDGFRLVKTRP